MPRVAAAHPCGGPGARAGPPGGGQRHHLLAQRLPSAGHPGRGALRQRDALAGAQVSHPPLAAQAGSMLDRFPSREA